MKKLMMMLFIVFALLCVTACTVDIQYPDVKVEKITVDGISKTEYVACDPLDLSSAMLFVTYDNGKTEKIQLTESMLDPNSYDMNNSGEQTVIVNYGGKTTQFNIVVKSWDLVSVTLESIPYVTDYIVGETIDPSGATIRCNFEGNKVKIYDVTTDMLQSYNNTSVGTEKIKLTYYGKEMSFDVNFYDMTPMNIKLISSATDNYVFEGLGERFDPTGMKVRVFYDNDQSPEKSVTQDLGDDVHIVVPDVLTGNDDYQKVTAVLMYCPDNYKTLYEYSFYGVPLVSEGDIVYPGKELASNEIIRGNVTIVLDEIKSKSYGTVKSIVNNNDGTNTIIVDTAVEYNLTSINVVEGQIIADDAHVGYYGSEIIRADGGGVVESVVNGVVVIRTMPTLEFECNVKRKSFEHMEIINLPDSEKFKTPIDAMIQGDNIDLSTGRVRVYYDDGSTEDFYLSSSKIRLVNSNVDSANRTLDISAAGKYELWIVYGGVLANRVSIYVTVNSRYPIQICMDSGKDYDIKDYYFGDTISITTWRFYVIYNNGDVGEREPITADMLSDDSSLYCADGESLKKIKFKLPARYIKNIPEGENKDLFTPEITYNVKPQPITGIAFMTRPFKVYVEYASEISFEGSTFAVYYKNGTYRTIKDWSAANIARVLVSDWNEAEEKVEAEKPVSGEKFVVVSNYSEEQKIILADILSGRTINGNKARLYYFDETGIRANDYVVFDYYCVVDGDGKGLVAEEINVVLSTIDGKPAYKTDYKQYEAWDLNGISLEIKYVGKDSVDKISVLNPNMIYSGSTDLVGNDIPIKFAFLGVTDDSAFNINVGERRPIEIIVEKQGRTVYPYSYEPKTGYFGDIDFSEYQIRMRYESGPSTVIDGFDDIGTEELSKGWWYKMYNEKGVRIYDMNFQSGTVYFELCYSYPTENGYEYITSLDYHIVMEAIENAKEESQEGEIEEIVEESIYTVEVLEENEDVVGIAYLLNVDINGKLYNVTNGKYLSEDESVLAEYAGLPVVAEVAAGWELMLEEYANGRVQSKILTVTRSDGSVSAVKLTPSMINYERDDTTEGYRKIIITYRNYKFEARIYVWNAELVSVNVFDKPLQNYIYTAIDDEGDLDKEGGTLRLVFNKRISSGVIVGRMYKYIDMNNEDIRYSGFPNPKRFSKDGEKVTITIVYKNYEELATNYTITLYDRQDVEFRYTNTIFFYGNATDAGAQPQQKIEEFSLPSVIDLRYVSTDSFITIKQYMSLDEETRKNYIPITMYDKDKEHTLSMFVENTYENIASQKFIDPAAGVFYVKYGWMAIVSEEDFEGLSDEVKDRFVAVPNYKRNREFIEYYYVYQPDDGNYDSSVEGEKIRWYKEIITEKISAREYQNLTAEEQSLYEEVANEYYLLMCVEDNRPLARRYYETTNYAFQTYTIISKVIDLSIEEGTEHAKVLRVTTKFAGEYGLSGNQYAVYYLQNAAIWNAIANDYKKAFMREVVLCSPNADYFEIVVKLNNALYVNSDEQNDQIAELFYRILLALTTDIDLVSGSGDSMGFKRITECTGLTAIDFNYGKEETLFNASAEVEIKDEILNKIKSAWQNGLNCFDLSDITDSTKVPGKDYFVSYFVRYGEMLTRNGKLQMLSGAMCVVNKTDGTGAIIDDEYSASIGTLYHSSYTIDIGTGNEIIIR